MLIIFILLIFLHFPPSNIAQFLFKYLELDDIAPEVAIFCFIWGFGVYWRGIYEGLYDNCFCGNVASFLKVPKHNPDILSSKPLKGNRTAEPISFIAHFLSEAQKMPHSFLSVDVHFAFMLSNSREKAKNVFKNVKTTSFYWQILRFFTFLSSCCSTFLRRYTFLW